MFDLGAILMYVYFFNRILQRLDSPVEIEANAAIFAADKLCSKTEKFSALAYEKFVTLLQGIMQGYYKEYVK